MHHRKEKTPPKQYVSLKKKTLPLPKLNRFYSSSFIFIEYRVRNNTRVMKMSIQFIMLVYIFILTQIVFQPGANTDYLFSTSADLVERLERYKNAINHLTFSCETFIYSTHIDRFTNANQLILKSIIDDTFAFGVSTDSSVRLTDVEQQNQKRLQQLGVEWTTLNGTVTNEMYESKTSKNERKRNASKVETFYQ